MNSADYRGRHRQRVTLLARIVGLVHKRNGQEWPVLVKHVATTPAMQQIPYDWSVIDV